MAIILSWFPALVSSLLLSVPAAARPDDTRGRDATAPSYGGIVVNQTITVGGQEFYRQFVSLWRERPMTDRHAISVHERPSARYGSQVWVEYAQRRIFQSALPNGRTGIGPLSERAVEHAYQTVIDLQVQRLLFQGGDLAHDEF